MLPTDDRPRYVVDASVVVKWHLRDEQDVNAADFVLDDFQEGRTRLVAPVHIRYEVPSAIRNAVRMGRETSSRGRLEIAGFLALSIPVFDDDSLIAAGYDQADRFGCSFYDGVYLALAEGVGSPLVHADRRLRNTLGARFPLALWLGDYIPHV